MEYSEFKNNLNDLFKKNDIKVIALNNEDCVIVKHKETRFKFENTPLFSSYIAMRISLVNFSCFIEGNGWCEIDSREYDYVALDLFHRYIKKNIKIIKRW